MRKLLSEPVAKKAAVFMTFICYFVMLFLAFGMVLSLLGRQTFILHTGGEVWDAAILAAQYSNWTWSGPFTGMACEIRIFANDEIDIAARIGLSIAYAANAIPAIISFWFLARVFGNVAKGKIFTEQNALFILYFGLLRIAAAVFVPFANLGVIGLANRLSGNGIYIATGQDMFNSLIPNIAFIVAAYIIHYGVKLQGEAEGDH